MTTKIHQHKETFEYIANNKCDEERDEAVEQNDVSVLNPLLYFWPWHDVPRVRI